tara:strand:- start:42027 stop:42251 length:225 start_codon:yes stop_codon:yes gene_type:complete
MNKKDTIIMIVLIFCLAGLSYMLGIEIGRTNNVTETEPQIIIREVEVNDKGFCVHCYKKLDYNEMFIIMNEFTN